MAPKTKSEEVMEAKAVEIPSGDARPKRSPAPNIIVDVQPHEERTAILAKLNSEHPEYVHMYQNPKVLDSDWELSVKKQTLVTDNQGFVVHHKGDPVVRMEKSVYDRIMSEGPKLSEAQMADVVQNDNLTVFRNPKKPNEKNNKEK